MSTLYNEITIDAPIEKIWSSLSNIEELERYDPTVKRSAALTEIKCGLGAARKVDMADGKNWFEEKVTIWEPNKALTYELTACSFPVHNLKHSYSFEQLGQPGYRTMDFTNRPMSGFIMVDDRGMKSKKDFDHWIDLALEYNKKAKASKKKK